MDECWNFSIWHKMFLSSYRKIGKKKFFQNSGVYLVKFGCENSSFSSPNNSLHLPAFAGLSIDFRCLNPLLFKNLCHTWANLGEMGQKLNFDKGFLLYEAVMRWFHGKNQYFFAKYWWQRISWITTLWSTVRNWLHGKISFQLPSNSIRHDSTEIDFTEN